MSAKSTVVGWGRRARNVFSRPVSVPVSTTGGPAEIDAFARRIDWEKLSVEQFIQVLDTLHMLGSAGAGIELSALSSETLAAVVKRVSKDHLAALAEHDRLRSVFLDEVFRRMSEQFIVAKAQKLDAVVCWRFSDGDPDDGYDRFQTVIEGGACISSIDLGRTPDATITVSAADFIRMATGNAAVATMFLTGKVKVKGDYQLAVTLSNYFDIPKPE